MRINTNLTAMNTYTQYTANNSKIAGAVAKLSSGYAINTAADNAAGLAISEKMRAQIRGLTKASANAQDAISLVQTAEGSLGEATEILQRMRELAVQSSSDTNENDIDRTALQDEFAQLQQELDDIASTTTFNKKNLLDGSLSASKKTVTDVKLANNSMAVSIGNAAAGKYSFSVSVREETSAIAAKKATPTAAMGSVATAAFTKVETDEKLSTAGALYNGNYTLETTINEKSLTVTARGDNGQNFYATLSEADITATSKELSLSFQSASGANDGFTVKLTLKEVGSTTENGLLALKNAIDDVTASIDGGVNKQDATYGVYASLTGGESVKLNAGDSSVTFSNGVTVSFDKLTATDVSVTSPNSKAIASVADASVTPGTTTGTASSFEVDLADVVADYTAGDVKTYTVSIGGQDYSVTTDGTEADKNAVRDKLGAAINAKKLSVAYDSDDAAGNAEFTAAYNDTTGEVTFTSGTGVNSVDIEGLAFDDVSVSATVAGPASLSSGIMGKIGNSADKSTTTTFDVTETAGKGLTFQVGANRGDEMVINLDAVDSKALGINSAKVTTQEAASAAINTVDSAINKVSSQRAYLGAIQNRLDYKINNLETSTENLTSAESQIRDVDMAKEMTAFNNANILQQAATAMLAQANSLPQNVLSLIRG